MSFRLSSFRLSGVRTGPNALAISRERARSEARVLVGCIAWLGGLVGRQAGCAGCGGDIVRVSNACPPQ